MAAVSSVCTLVSALATAVRFDIRRVITGWRENAAVARQWRGEGLAIRRVIYDAQLVAQALQELA